MGLVGGQIVALSGSNGVCLPGDGSRFDVWNTGVINSLAHGQDDA